MTTTWKDAMAVAMAVAFLAAGVAGAKPQASNPVTRFQTVEIEGLNIFYRGAGNPKAPAVLRLHGFALDEDGKKSAELMCGHLDNHVR